MSRCAEIECVLDAKATLGEGTFWDTREQVLWWINIWGKEIHRFDPATGLDRVWPAPEDVGCLAVRETGGLVVSRRSGFFFFDPTSGRFDPIVDPEAGRPETRFNNGKTDRQGRFYAGTVYEVEGKPTLKTAALYRLDLDLSCHRIVEGIGISNGLAWSPDGKTMYYGDSSANRVWVFDFDIATGTVENRRLFIDTTDTGGVPDGATVDAEGCYWLTLPATSRVTRYDLDGKEMETVIMPTDLPTCCGFGGKDLEILYVTSGTVGRPASKLAGQAHAGGLFTVHVGVKGLPEARFGS